MEAIVLNLKNGKITVGELLDDPRSRAVLQKRFPAALRHPMTGAARTVTLEQLLAAASAWLPRRKLDEALEELRRV